MSRRLQQLKALSLEEWRLLLSAMVLLPLIALSLRLRGVKYTQNTMRRFVPEESNLSGPSQADMDKAWVIARIVSVAAGHGAYRANCLKKSLVLWWLLARRGIKSVIIFGVPKESMRDFFAHAWVECNGVNLSDSDEIQQQFTAFQKRGETLGVKREE